MCAAIGNFSSPKYNPNIMTWGGPLGGTCSQRAIAREKQKEDNPSERDFHRDSQLTTRRSLSVDGCATDFFPKMDYSTVISAARYECVVCHLKSVTIAELHRHQTYRHTTEELSLCTIGLRVSLNNGTSNGVTYARSWLCDPQKRFEFYAYSARLLNNDDNNNNNNNGENFNVPLDYVLEKKDLSSEDVSESNDRPLETDQRKVPQKRVRSQRRIFDTEILDLSRKSCDDETQVEGPTSMDTSEDVFESTKQPRRTKIKRTTARTKKVLAKRRITSEKRKARKNHGKIERFVKNVPRKKDYPKKRREESEKIKEEDNRGMEEKVRRQPKRKLTLGERSRAKRAKVLDIDSGKIVPPGAGTSTLERAEKIDNGSRKEERKEKQKIENNENNTVVDKICVDRVNVSEDYSICSKNTPRLDGFERFSIHPQNDVPEIAHEVCVDFTGPDDDSPVNWETSSPMKIENFEKAESFPVYPRNMDERSILVIDPTTYKLVWTSFELKSDESISGNYEDRDNTSDVNFYQDYDSPVLENYVVTENTESSSPLSIKFDKDTSSPRDACVKSEINRETLESEEYSSQTNFSQRPKRRFTYPSPFSIKSYRGKDTSSRSVRRQSGINETTLTKERSKRSTLPSSSSIKSEQNKETKETSLTSEEKARNRFSPLRSRRNRTIPNRYVPY